MQVSRKTTRWRDDARGDSTKLRADAARHGFPHAVIGESAGAMAAMAARLDGALEAERYVCLNAPRSPYPPIESIRAVIGARASVLDRCVDYYSAQFRMRVDQLDASQLYRYADQGRLMVVYDREERCVGSWARQFRRANVAWRRRPAGLPGQVAGG